MPDTRARRVTALMTCHNGESFLEEAVASVFDQSREADEIVLFDNASTDGTHAVFERAAQIHPRVRRYSVDKKLAPAASMARGLTFCSTKFVAFFHADDISHRNRLKLQMNAASDRAAVVGSSLEEVDEHLNSLGIVEYPEESEDICNELSNRNVVALPAALISMPAVRSVGGFRPEASYATDYDLWLRMAEAGLRFKTIPQALVKYRRHSNQGSAQSDPQLLWCKFDVLLASAFRTKLGYDPFHENTRLWGSTPLRMLDHVVPGQRRQISRLIARLNQSTSSWEDHREVRDAALALLRDSRFPETAVPTVSLPVSTTPDYSLESESASNG